VFHIYYPALKGGAIEAAPGKGFSPIIKKISFFTRKTGQLLRLFSDMDQRNASVEDLLCDESFQRYCRGDNQADVLFWENWIKENPGQLPIVAAAKRMYDMLNLGQGNRLEQLAGLKDAVARRSMLQQELLQKTPARSYFKYAASILLLVTVAAFIYIKYRTPSKPVLAGYEFYTGPKDRRTVMLPDGSVVMLNRNSHLSVSRDFDAHHRKVSITGEAFFDIEHDTEYPFLVSTSQYTIRVLGTTFNVKSYPGKDTTETTLLTGKIEILEDDATAGVVLKPNQKFMLAELQTGKQALLSKGKVLPPAMNIVTHHLVETSWARRKMDIKDQTLGEIAEQLQAWYGVKIRFADDTVRTYRFTATFDDETVFNALQYLQQSYPFTYSIVDDCIVIAK
jgi:transmembrane sensor